MAGEKSFARAEGSSAENAADAASQGRRTADSRFMAAAGQTPPPCKKGFDNSTPERDRNAAWFRPRPPDYASGPRSLECAIGMSTTIPRSTSRRLLDRACRSNSRRSASGKRTLVVVEAGMAEKLFATHCVAGRKSSAFGIPRRSGLWQFPAGMARQEEATHGVPIRCAKACPDIEIRRSASPGLGRR